MAPRQILKTVAGVNLVEMTVADSCCGGAGSYGFTHPEISGRIAASKIDPFKIPGTRVLAISCSACTLQLGAGLRRASLKAALVHPVELLAKATGVTDS